MKVQRTEYMSIYQAGEFVICRMDATEYSPITWQIHEGTAADFFDCKDTWCSTWPTLRDAKQALIDAGI